MRNGKPWDESEINYLKHWYPLKGSRHVAKHLKRTIASVQNKASTEGIPAGLAPQVLNGNAMDAYAIALAIGGDMPVASVFKWFRRYPDGLLATRGKRVIVDNDTAHAYIAWNKDFRQKLAAGWIPTKRVAQILEMNVGVLPGVAAKRTKASRWLMPELEKCRHAVYPNKFTLWHPADVYALKSELDKRGRLIQEKYTACKVISVELDDLHASSLRRAARRIIKEQGFGHVWYTGGTGILVAYYISNDVCAALRERYKDRLIDGG